jgi:hypothetical protein
MIPVGSTLRLQKSPLNFDKRIQITSKRTTTSSSSSSYSFRNRQDLIIDHQFSLAYFNSLSPVWFSLLEGFLKIHYQVMTLFKHEWVHLGFDGYGDGHAEYYSLEYNDVYSVERQPTFRRNLSPPPSGWNKPSTIPTWEHVVSCCQGRKWSRRTPSFLTLFKFWTVLLYKPKCAEGNPRENSLWVSCKYHILRNYQI